MQSINLTLGGVISEYKCRLDRKCDYGGQTSKYIKTNILQMCSGRCRRGDSVRVFRQTRLLLAAAKMDATKSGLYEARSIAEEEFIFGNVIF